MNELAWLNFARFDHSQHRRVSRRLHPERPNDLEFLEDDQIDRHLDVSALLLAGGAQAQMAARVCKLYNAGMAVCSSPSAYGHMRALAGDDIASS